MTCTFQIHVHAIQIRYICYHHHSSQILSRVSQILNTRYSFVIFLRRKIMFKIRCNKNRSLFLLHENSNFILYLPRKLVSKLAFDEEPQTKNCTCSLFFSAFCRRQRLQTSKVHVASFSLNKVYYNPTIVLLQLQ